MLEQKKEKAINNPKLESAYQDSAKLCDWRQPHETTVIKNASQLKTVSLFVLLITVSSVLMTFSSRLTNDRSVEHLNCCRRLLSYL